MSFASAVQEAVKAYPRPAHITQFTYGTAGFRMKGEDLDHVMFGMGLLSGLRSRRLNGQTIGVMVTASHNPAIDNGVKLVDPMGEMLDQDWEQWATQIVNGKTPEETAEAYKTLQKQLNIDPDRPAKVIFARDTRPSGLRLIKALVAGLVATNVEYEDFGILTTPQLHYLVRASNTQHEKKPYGKISAEGYYEKLAGAFKLATKHLKFASGVTVDCANGVGGPKLAALLKYLLPVSEGGLPVTIQNDRVEQAEVLNKDCGADYVKTQQKVPSGFNGKAKDRWCSLDGDADRIVYYFVEEGNTFRLLDGDRIATLAASFLGDLVERCGLSDKIKIGVIQTAYANGASTAFIQNRLKLKTEFTATGVKHLHHAATRYDIGVYFEANGHGTILFSQHALKAIYKTEPHSPAHVEALETLRACTDLINQTVGDALSDFLLVELILAYKEYTAADWLSNYNDLPNKLSKVKVPDRSAFTTVPNTAEQKLASPSGLQESIDGEVVKYKSGRCFVRASGTEDAVRVYGEAADIYDVEHMIKIVEDLVRTRASSDYDEANKP